MAGNKNSGNTLKLKKENVILALKKSGGFISHTARLLRVTPMTIRNYIARDEEIAQALEDIEAYNLDMSEFQLLKKIRKGDLGAVQYHLNKKGAGRGYGEQKQLPGNVTNNLNVNLVKALPNMPDEQLDEIEFTIKEVEKKQRLLEDKKDNVVDGEFEPIKKLKKKPTKKPTKKKAKKSKKSGKK